MVRYRAPHPPERHSSGCSGPSRHLARLLLQAGAVPAENRRGRALEIGIERFDHNLLTGSSEMKRGEAQPAMTIVVEAHRKLGGRRRATVMRRLAAKPAAQRWQSRPDLSAMH